MAVPLELVREVSTQMATPANPGFIAMANKCLDGTLVNNLYYVIRAAEVAEAMVLNYTAHIADTPGVHTAADAVNVYTITYFDKPLKQWFGGEYAKSIPGFDSFGMRQIERNDPWSDKVQLIALLYQMVGVFDAFKTAFNAHIGTAVHPNPDADNTIAGSIVIPSADGIVPSLIYNQQIAGMTVHKQLVELERSEPAYVKAKLGTLIANIIVAYKEVIDSYNAHLGNSLAAYHVAADTVNVITVKSYDLTL